MGNLDVIQNRESIEPLSNDYEPLPAGIYDAIVTSSEVVPTKAGGLMLKVTHTILDEHYKGRLIFTNFNIKNDNEKAQQIGLGTLSSLSRAVGLLGIPNESYELHDKPHSIKLAVKAGSGINPKNGEPYKPSNEIRGYFPLGSTKPKAKHEDKPTVGPATKSSMSASADDVPEFWGK